MAIVVEFYGIPRARAGVSQAQIFDDLASVSFGQVIEEVARQYPSFGTGCTRDGRELLDGYIASIDGDRFVHGDDVTVSSGQSVLILSADAGG